MAKAPRGDESPVDITNEDAPAAAPLIPEKLTAASLSPADLAALVRTDQFVRWRRGERMMVEAYVERFPQLSDDDEHLLDLLRNEILLRRERGERLRREEFIQRYPEFVPQLERQLLWLRELGDKAKPALEEGSVEANDVKETATRRSEEPDTAKMAAAARRTAQADAKAAAVAREAALAAVAAETTSDEAKPVQVKQRVSVPGYELVTEVGRGGMGVVYKARQLRLNRLVALKMVLTGSHAGKDELARFRTEAEAVAALQHPNIVQVYEVGELHNPGEVSIPFMILEFIDGGNLAAKLAGTPLPARSAAHMLEAMAEAMSAAHERGVIHRDLKPDNVLLTTSGIPKITDFGLAKLMGHDTGRTATGIIMGTPSYMAPEQAEGQSRHIGPATDVYALGAILYEMLTGRPPFRAATSLDTIKQVVGAEPVPPSQLEPKVPRDLETICLKCLQKPPSRRYASAEALAQDLRHFLKGEPIQARPIRAWERGVKWVKRRPTEALLSAAGVLTLLGLLIGGLWYQYTAQLRKAYQSTQQREEEAERNHQEAVHRLVKLDVANGMRSADDGNPMDAVLWLTDALLQDQETPDHQVAHRIRIAAVVNACPKLMRMKFHDGRVHCAHFSPDGTHVAASGESARAQVWNIESVNQQPSLVLQHEGPVNHVIFSADGRWLATASEDRTARVWDAARGVPRLPPLQHGGPVYMARFSPDGRYVATASEDQAARIWDAATGALVCVPLEHTGPVRGVEFSSDSRRVVTHSLDHTARVWDAATGKPVTPPLRHAEGVYCATFSPDGRLVATASADHTARVWDAATGAPLSLALKHFDIVMHVAFSPDGQNVATASQDNTARVWDVNTSELRAAPMHHQDPVVHVAFSHNGLRVLTSSEDNTARIWDATTGEPISPSFKHNGTVHHAMFSPDDTRVVTGSQDGTLRIWDAVPPERVTRPHRPLHSFDRTWTSPDGKFVVTQSKDFTLRIRDQSSGQSYGAPMKHDGYIYHVSFSPQADRIVSSSSDQTARVWDVATGKRLCPPLRHASKVYHASFSADGKRIATGSDDNTARIWDAATGKSIGPALMHASSVYHASFNEDGYCLLTANRDGSARVWDVTEAELLTPPLPYLGWVKAVLASGGDKRDWVLPRAQHSLADLLVASQAISGQRLDPTGGLLALEPEEFRVDWMKLRELFPKDFGATPADIRAWHQREAKYDQDNGLWFAAVWHLDRLIALEPTNNALVEQRDKAQTALEAAAQRAQQRRKPLN